MDLRPMFGAQGNHVDMNLGIQVNININVLVVAASACQIACGLRFEVPERRNHVHEKKCVIPVRTKVLGLTRESAESSPSSESFVCHVVAISMFLRLTRQEESCSREEIMFDSGTLSCVYCLFVCKYVSRMFSTQVKLLNAVRGILLGRPCKDCHNRTCECMQPRILVHMGKWIQHILHY